jgi:uncharacterized protein YdhG (YjbR/CyaY superfamily)
MSDVDQYLARLPSDRRAAVSKVRAVINANLPAGYEEKIQYGMISWCVPESVLPAKDVYNKQPLCLASLASQKHHMAVYLLHVYGDPKLRGWFEKAYQQTGKKLDMGQSCVRFKNLDALPLDVIGEAMSKVTVDRYVAGYRRLRDSRKKPKPATRKSAAAKAKKPIAKRPAKRPVAKQPARKPAKKSAKRATN